MKKLTWVLILIFALTALTLTACGKETFTVKFNSKCDTVIDPQNVLSEETLIEPEPPSKKGYTFLGWYFGDEKWSFADGVVTQSMTLTAKWELTEYSITYNLNGGSVDNNPDSYNLKSDDITLKNPTRPFYTFIGWTESDTDSPEKMIFIESGSTGNREFTAQWRPTTYSLSYNFGGGEKVNNPTNYNVETDSFTLINPTREGYTFLGWTWDGSSTPTLNVTVEKGSKGTKAFTAHWQPITYGITYHLNGGTVSSANPESYTCENSFVLKNPTKEGFTFKGWTYIGQPTPTKTVIVSKGTTGDKEFIANWICKHVDENEDLICDSCNEPITVYYPWDNQTIIFMMTENTNNKSLSSGCHKYLAGDDPNASDTIDTAVKQRNSMAESETKITVTYQYWPDNENYGWGDSIEKIYTIVYSNTTNNVPDIYCNFVYDIVGASVRGCFANLKSQARGLGELAGLNYFEFLADDYDAEEDDRGYMHEYMESITLSKHKMYVLASDYFIDLFRALTVIPVSVELIESVGPTVTGERDGVEGWSIDDFYEQVFDGEWTYSLMMDYAAAVYQDDGNSATTKTWLGDTLGFALSDSSVGVGGLIYTSNVAVVSKEFNVQLNDFVYSYPQSNENLSNLVTKITSLIHGTGITNVSDSNTGVYAINTWGGTSMLAIRTRFSQNKVLFGDIIMLGALEYSEYQSMKNPDGSGGFGVVCVPLYENGGSYMSQIHSAGRSGAISINTLKFAECTAFLNYQSTNSTDILNSYYSYLKSEVVSSDSSSDKMLNLIRSNIRTSHDCFIEDELGIFHGREMGYNNKLTFLITNDGYMESGFEDFIDNTPLKSWQLETLESYYLMSPN